jgi:chromosome segregation ATPase
MKSAVKALLAAVGLAPARQIASLSAQTREAADRVAALEDRASKLRTDVDHWKRRHEESAGAAAEWKQAASTAGTRAQRAEAEVEALKARSEALATKARTLREQLDKAKHEATSAQEHLMAMEVKLDLIEAAIQVLDVRTRDRALARVAVMKADV